MASRSSQARRANRSPPRENEVLLSDEARIQLLIAKCYEDGAFTERISQGVVVVDGEDIFRGNRRVGELTTAWLKERLVMVIFQGAARDFPIKVREDLIRAYENGSYQNCIFDRTVKRGRVHGEGLNIMTYIAMSRQVAQWMVAKGEDKVTVRGVEYRMLFKQWLTRRELDERRRMEDETRFWTMALRVPVRAMFPLKDMVSKRSGSQNMGASASQGQYGPRERTPTTRRRVHTQMDGIAGGLLQQDRRIEREELRPEQGTTTIVVHGEATGIQDMQSEEEEIEAEEQDRIRGDGLERTLVVTEQHEKERQDDMDRSGGSEEEGEEETYREIAPGVGTTESEEEERIENFILPLVCALQDRETICEDQLHPFSARRGPGKFSYKWIQRGVATIKDLWVEESYNWLSNEQLKDKLGQLPDQGVRRDALIQAIPQSWKDLIAPTGVNPVESWYRGPPEEGNRLYKLCNRNEFGKCTLEVFELRTGEKQQLIPHGTAERYGTQDLIEVRVRETPQPTPHPPLLQVAANGEALSTLRIDPTAWVGE
ncbi:hypothetical protein CBR_g37655 [Chara braunii]|uniref:Uncharacterized protein n=1 Tax=Chara braunii TaxID=69332 RepID=A0A388LNC8_CHABU|nr:hypothetical protein CBR_g37655 [Chara braunii]|eukprot:GBG83856.1 hypothetical protein CBR_g37655 [Chara braunii]